MPSGGFGGGGGAVSGWVGVNVKESVRRSRSTSVRLGGLCEANGDAAMTVVSILWCASSLSRVPDGARQENHFIVTLDV